MASTNELVTPSMTTLNVSDEKKTFKTMSFKEKLSYVKTFITVEPVIFFYFVPSMICGPALYTLQLEKACLVNAGFDDEICYGIINGVNETLYANETDVVQSIVGTMQTWVTPVQNLVPLLLILFVASYSDRHKIRKPFILLPIAGEFLAIAGCILCVIFMKEIPVEFQGFSQTVLPSFLGGSATAIMATFAYISDISTLEMRTLRIGVIQIVLTVVSLLSGLGGYLFTQIGYYGVLVIGGVSYLISFTYGLFFIKEKARRVKHESVKDFCGDVFRPDHALATLKLLVSPKRVNIKQLYLVIVVFFISCLVIFGEVIIFWLFAQNVYGYTPVKYSYYDSIRNALNVIGGIFFLYLFTKVLKLHDATIVAVTFIDKIVSNVLLITLLNEVGLYAGTFVANCASIGNTALRSLATKSVKVEDLAKALSLLSLCETFANMASGSLYSSLYVYTLATKPESFLYVGVGLFSGCVVVILILYYCHRSMFTIDLTPKPKEEKKDEKSQDIYLQTTKL